MKKLNLIKILPILLLLISCCNKQNTIFLLKTDNNINQKTTNSFIDDILFLKIIYFEFDSHELTMEAKQNLNLLVKYLQQEQNINKTITLSGYCDNIGIDKYNYNLGLNRTKATKKYLMSSGIDSSRINIVSFGKKDGRKVVININNK